MLPVFGGKQRSGCRPGNADGRIIPGNTAFIFRMVVISTLVQKIGGFRQDAKTVGKAGRNIHLQVIGVTENRAEPFAEGRRAGTDINGNIEDFSAGDLDQFTLRKVELKVETPQYAFAGAGMVVLDERQAEAGIAVSLCLERLQEKTALIAEDLGFDQNDFRN